MAALKLVGVATVDDDDSLHEVGELLGDDRDHLQAQQRHETKYGSRRRSDLTVSEVMYFRSWCFPPVVGRTKGLVKSPISSLESSSLSSSVSIFVWQKDLDL